MKLLHWFLVAQMKLLHWVLVAQMKLLLLQMVVVSDDVHEYAVALKDTEEKIARCPASVSVCVCMRDSVCV